MMDVKDAASAGRTRQRGCAPAAGSLTGPVGPRVLILGGDSDANLGDHAILSGLCHALVAAAPAVRITVTASRSRSAALKGTLPGVVDVRPRGVAGFGSLLTAAASHDCVLIAGGGLFQDDDSRVKMPYWAARLACLGAVNGAIGGVSLGVGPLHRAESRFWARRACARLRDVAVRDPFARDWLEGALGRPVPIVPDPAFLVPPAGADVAERRLREAGVRPGEPLIGVALRGWFHARGGWMPHRLRARLVGSRRSGRAETTVWLDQVAQALRVLAADLGARVLLLPSYPLPHEGDVAMAGALARRMRAQRPACLLLRDPGEYKAVCGALRLMVGARMHPLILAAGMNVPIVGMGYNGKFDGLFRMLEAQARVVPLDAFPARDCVPALVDAARRALAEDRHAAASRVLAARTSAAAGGMLERLVGVSCAVNA